MKQLVGERMFPLTLDGLEKAMKELSRKLGSWRAFRPKLRDRKGFA
jgi:hypothetical protein